LYKQQEREKHEEHPWCSCRLTSIRLQASQPNSSG
jgi:hypothetical protein